MEIHLIGSTEFFDALLAEHALKQPDDPVGAHLVRLNAKWIKLNVILLDILKKSKKYVEFNLKKKINQNRKIQKINLKKKLKAKKYK